MSSISLISLLPLIILWIFYRISRHAMAPLLADMRAASPRHVGALPIPTAGASNLGTARPLLQALVVGGVAVLICVILYSTGQMTSPPRIAFPLSATYDYQYNPYMDTGTMAGLALGLLAFARTARGMAFLAFVVLMVLAFLYDLAFNLIGAVNFGTQSDFYGGGDLGQNIWVIYIVGYAAAVAVGLSLFSQVFRGFLPWLTLLAAGAAGQFFLASWMSSNFNGVISDPWVVYVVTPSITVAVAAGLWMRPSSTS